MTEQTWLTVVELSAKLHFVNDKTTERKLRLFTVACARRALPYCTSRAFHDALATAERFADDPAAEAEPMRLTRNRVTRQTKWKDFNEQGLANALMNDAVASAAWLAAQYAHDIARPRSPSAER